MAYLPTESIVVTASDAHLDRISVAWSVELTDYGRERAEKIAHADAEDYATATASVLFMIASLGFLFALLWLHSNNYPEPYWSYYLPAALVVVFAISFAGAGLYTPKNPFPLDYRLTTSHCYRDGNWNAF